MNTKTLVLSSFIATVAFFAAGPVNAATTCTPIYGGGQNCVESGNIVIDKKVQNPVNFSFVDNLGVNDPRYAPNQNVPFEINVTNIGPTTFSKVSIKDFLPQYIVLADGNINMEMTDLKPNESRKVMIVGRVVDANQLPGNQSVTCVVNQATATTNNNQGSADNAQFCIEKAGVPTTITQPGPTVIQQAQPQVVTKGGLKVFPAAPAQKTPATGPEALALFGLIPSAVLGYFLRKKSL